ncbi:hypothetical protein [Paenibacillus soyae]|uniref:Uncharacterized protein n=1 Tax=Paenibacillus soyae TaxID=2969249 RepID=A0A9X2MS07_9BACL|nr:hypothetical protein [Paenibacillus soyae]MCR2805764.1 hypothetical protein [Paenibacillus soyae]
MHAQTEKIIEGYRYYGRSNLANVNAFSAALKQAGSGYGYTPWLYGAMGAPFLFRTVEDVNTEPVLHELPHERIVGLLNNLGVRVEGMSEVASGERLAALREEAWNTVRDKVDRGIPCFGRGFYFSYGETSVVQGYNAAEGTYIISCWHDIQSVPRHTLGERDGLVDLYWMTSDGQTEDDRRTVRDALALAVEYAEGRLTSEDTYVGVAAYGHWVEQLRKGAVDGWFFAYAAHEWDTLKTHGYKFLEEAKVRLGTQAPAALDQAIREFKAVQARIHQVYELFPWSQPRGLITDTERRLEAARLLEEAAPHDAAAIEAFRSVVDELGESADGNRGMPA